MSHETSPTHPVLEVRDAAKSFGATRALAGAELSLAAGEWLGLLGPNGAGKTTLVKAISGRVRLDAGNLRLMGRPLRGGSEAARRVRRRLGVVPQEIALYPTLTARENLAAFGALRGLAGTELRDRVAWALDWTALAERADQSVEQFSGGMQRRLNLAAGVLHRPEVLLLDEPTVGVDPQSRERIWQMLDDLRRGGTSLLLTTHQLDEAQTVCERIVILDHGRTVAAGTLDELVERTVGRRRRVRLTLEHPLEPPAGVEIEASEDGQRWTLSTADVGAELAAVLPAIGCRGGRVLDVRVEAPSLQAVFLHLTGRELRE